jgi:hypothetical protein
MSAETLLRLPRGALGSIAEHVRHYGAKGLETGAFLLADEAAPSIVVVVAFSGERGVTRRPDLFHVSGRALERLFTWADELRMRVRAQLHSHRREAFLSRTDQNHGLSVRGFTSAVIPNFVDPPRDPVRWGWWRFDGDAWLAIPPASLTETAVRFITFDEDGIRDDA